MNSNPKLSRPVLVVEDRPSERERIGQALASLNVDGVYVDKMGDTKTKITAEYSMLIMDLHMDSSSNAVRDSLDFLREFRRIHSTTPILIVSVHDPKIHEVREIIAARAGYLFRKSETNISISELTSILQLTLEGSLFYSPGIANFLPSLVENAFSVENPLTSKQMAVLSLLAKDLTPDQIAELMGIDAGTVRSHKMNIRDRLLERGLISGDSDIALIDWYKENRYKYDSKK